MERIGIYGGSFDPIHNGHLAIAEEARWALSLTRLYLVPAAEQPFKQGLHGASAAQRLAMTELASRDNPDFRVSDLEIDRPPPSYTIDTIREFRRQYPDAELFFIVGADALNSFPSWNEADEILKLARIAALNRPGYAMNMTDLRAKLPTLPFRLDLVDGPQLEISSSDLRRRFASGKPVRYQLPDAVLSYIDYYRLYR